jgi:SAM-dependent methyltransferase
MKQKLPMPTSASARVNSEKQRWSRIFAGREFYYGEDPGPVARRAVRYHRPLLPFGGTALDAGCGEGQDLAFLAEQGYQATGLDFTAEGVAKARRFLEERGLKAEVRECDLSQEPLAATYDLVIAVNSVQFMGECAEPCLEKLMAAVKPGGVIGLSLFACEDAPQCVVSTIFFISLEELLRRFDGWQPLEAAKLWQWNSTTGQPQAFVTLIARKL